MTGQAVKAIIMRKTTSWEWAKITNDVMRKARSWERAKITKHVTRKTTSWKWTKITRRVMRKERAWELADQRMRQMTMNTIARLMKAIGATLILLNNKIEDQEKAKDEQTHAKGSTEGADKKLQPISTPEA